MASYTPATTAAAVGASTASEVTPATATSSPTLTPMFEESPAISRPITTPAVGRIGTERALPPGTGADVALITV